jgi:hypothetical protein
LSKFVILEPKTIALRYMRAKWTVRAPPLPFQDDVFVVE